MPNYDDLFTEQPTRQEQPAFDKDALGRAETGGT